MISSSKYLLLPPYQFRLVFGSSIPTSMDVGDGAGSLAMRNTHNMKITNKKGADFMLILSQYT